MLIRKWRSFLAWSEEKQQLFRSAFILLPVVRTSLWLAGFKRTQSLLRMWVGQQQIADEPDQQVWLTEKAIRYACWYLPIEANCLTRSLVLKHLLDKQGIDTDLRIGIRQQDGKFEAHAWVEYGGRIANDSSDIVERYSAFQSPIQLSHLTMR